MAGLEPAELARLRKKAEILSRATSRSVPKMEPQNVEALVQELRVHQIELELQCQELQRAQAVVEESLDRYRELYESIPIGYITIDSKGRIYDLNPVGASLLGIERIEDSQLKNFFFFFNDDGVDAATLFCRNVVSDQEPSCSEMEMKKLDETRFVGSLQAAPVRVGEGKGERLRIAFRDITREKETEEMLRQHQVELEANRTELQDLMGKLFTAQEEERRRIACDIHDDHCQRLTALILEASALANQFKAAMPSLLPRMESMKEKLSDILDDFRHLTHELHPRHLETVSLAWSMRSYIKEFSNYSGLRIDFSEEGIPGHLPMPITICLYRLLQESLGNIYKHANATSVRIRLSGTPDQIRLSVVDDGTGFTPGVSKGHRKGLGLTSMQERVRPLRGRISIESAVGRGTSVTVMVPVACEA
ncbi:MAG TPA: ATP-binding protein [Nitrospira sp.]|nr:ATP-binding protein [Nitrospira sp.]